MTIRLNNVEHEVAVGTSLAAFLEQLSISPKGVAVAIDYTVVPKDQWDEFILTDQLEIMLIHAVSGG